MARARLPAAISDFDGTQPVLRQSPPILPFSTSTTDTPKAAAAAATESPPEPAPMTQMSGFRRSAMRPKVVIDVARQIRTFQPDGRATRRRDRRHHDRNERDDAERRERGEQLRRDRRIHVERRAGNPARPAARQDR